MSLGKEAQPSDQQLRKTTGTIAIQQLILRERSARDMKDWDTLASCFTEDSRVEMSSFRDSGASFAVESRKGAAGGLLTFHETGPALSDVAGDRAIADIPMAAHVIRELHGSEVDVTFWTRMRIERSVSRTAPGFCRVFASSTSMT